MNTTHSIMKCPVSKEDITIISYPPFGSAWAGFRGGRSEIICPYLYTIIIHPCCRKDSGAYYTSSSDIKGKNACIMINK